MLKMSVVIPTFRRHDLLKRCLTALRQQSLSSADFEVLVCDDAAGRFDTLDIQQLVEEFARSGLQVHYLPVTKNHGPAAARNVGWHAARGWLVAFTDDDTMADPKWLAEGLEAFEKGSGRQWQAAVGQTHVPLPEQPTDYEKNESGLSRAEFITANCFCRKSALEAVGGFDESFTMAWREDSDLHFSLIKSAGESSLGRIPSAVVVHPVRPASWGVCLKQVQKVVFNALLYKKHPELYRKRIQSHPPWNYYLAVCSLLSGVAAAFAGRQDLSWALLALWILLISEFAVRRLKGTSRSWSHVLEMWITSFLIPPLAIFWRLYGAFKFRVLFV